MIRKIMISNSLSTQVSVSPGVRKYMKGTFLTTLKCVFNLSRRPDKYILMK